jgi:capsular polysaccharide export protein
MRRSFLTLQGTASPFFRSLEAALEARGHAVQRVNFCGGDHAYGDPRAALDYTGPASELPGWYADVLDRSSISDVVLFGDCREIHRHMHPLAQARGVNVHVFEEGYVRPHYLTLERVGVNGRSLLPRDPSFYLAQRDATPQWRTGEPTGYNLYERAMHDMRYRAANTLYRQRYPHYRSHRPKNGLIEYGGLAARLLKQRHFDREAAHLVRELIESKRRFYLFALQLNADSQIVHHSPFGDIREVLERVMRSFADNAPAGTWLVIKNHPLDTGLVDYRGHVARLAQELGIGARVQFIDGGHLPTLLDHARAVVVVNSTVGISALYHKRPLIALGTAIYALPGLTWQDGLDAFWRGAQAPDYELFLAFLDYIVHHTQLNGDFYTRTGIAMAASAAVARLEGQAHA